MHTNPIIAITSDDFAGKKTILPLFKEAGFKHILIEKHQPNYFEALCKDILSEKSPCVVETICCHSEYYKLLIEAEKDKRPFHLIFLTADQEKRHQRYLLSNPQGEIEDLEKFKAREYKERMGGWEAWDKNVKVCAVMANQTFYNDSSIEDFQNTIRVFLSQEFFLINKKNFSKVREKEEVIATRK